MTAAITYSACNAVLRPPVRSYRTLTHARDAYTEAAVNQAQREAERLGKPVTIELWDHWGTLHARRISYREIWPTRRTTRW